MSTETLLIISQVFYPDEVSTAALLTDLAIELSAENNVNVEVWCAQPSYTTHIRQSKHVLYKGININYIASTNFSKNNILGRLLNYISFSFFLFFKLFFSFEKTPILTVTNPPFLGIIISLIKKIKKRNFYYIIHDVYPDGLVRLGDLSSNSYITKIWSFLNKWVLKNAEAVIVLGRDMQKLIENIIPELKTKIHYIPNWQNNNLIETIDFTKSKFVKDNFLDNFFVIQYSGNMGIWHDMESIAIAAKSFENTNNMFCFIGNGKGKKNMLEVFGNEIPGNVKFFPFQPKEYLSHSLSACHIALISLKKNLEGVAVPSKLYGILASGRAIIAQVPKESEIAYAIEEENCGIVVEPCNSTELVKAIKYLTSNLRLCQTMGLNARKAFEKKYTTKIIAQKYLDLFNSLK